MSQAWSAPKSAEASRRDVVRLSALVMVAVLLADVASKNWALAAVGGGYVDLGLLGLTVVENDGLALSAGAGVLSRATVLAVRLTALAAVLLLAWRFAPYSRRLAVGFALILGGGLGNTLDVVFRDGAVVDFISTSATAGLGAGPPVPTGLVMNLADVWILAGIPLLHPLFRILGLAAQRRFRHVEARVLGL